MLFNTALIYFYTAWRLQILEVHDNGNEFSPDKAHTGCSLKLYVRVVKR